MAARTLGKTKQNLDPSTIRKRGFKVLLYADNPEHMQTFVRIRRNKKLREYFVGCWHTLRWDSGEEILTGSGKKHCHLVFSFPNPRYWSGILADLGLSQQFCRPIGLDRDTIDGGYVYLIHANAPDKEQYQVSDLFGAPERVDAAKAAILAYQMRHVTLAESLEAIRTWINSQFGERITPNQFIAWIVKTPYVRAASNPFVRELLWSHNQVIQNAYSDYQMEQYAEGLAKFDELLKAHGWREIV